MDVSDPDLLRAGQQQKLVLSQLEQRLQVVAELSAQHNRACERASQEGGQGAQPDERRCHLVGVCWWRRLHLEGREQVCKQPTVWRLDLYLQRASDQQVAGLDRVAGGDNGRLSRRTVASLDQGGTLGDHAVDLCLFSCGEGDTAVALGVGGLHLLCFQGKLGEPTENLCFGCAEPLSVQGDQQHIDGIEKSPACDKQQTVHGRAQTGGGEVALGSQQRHRFDPCRPVQHNDQQASGQAQHR